MERKTAVAAAAALTMSVVSGLFALGAGTGALGLGSSSAPAVSTTAPAGSATTSPRTHEVSGHDDSGTTIQARGEIDD
jgi:hypothetical protein